MGGEARPLFFGVLVLLILTVLLVVRMEVNSDITHFLPGGHVSDDVTLARQLASGELSRTMVLLVAAPNQPGAIQASRDLEQALLSSPQVSADLAFLEGGPPEGINEALWQLYHPRRFSFLADGTGEAALQLTPEGLDEAAARLKKRLALPISGLVSRVAPGDPLLVLPRMFERLAGSRGERLQVAEGRFLTEGGRSAVLFLGTRSRSFDSSAQRPFLDGVYGAFDEVNRAHQNSLTLSLSGANRFALRAEEAIRSDIFRVTIGSIAGLSLLFLFLFRSLRLVLMTLPVLGAGFLVGTSACLLLFGKVHGLTLAFGAALIGVSIDYTVHFYCHQMLAPHREGPRNTLKGIWKGLFLGAATTVVGFIALVISTFPGLRELAVFASFGIVAALLATRVFLPGMMPRQLGATRSGVWIASTMGRAVSALGQRRAVLLALVLAIIGLAAVGLPRVTWNDDIADLNRLDPELVLEDAAVRDQVVRYEQRRMVVSLGADEQEALEVNDQVASVLQSATEAGELEGFRSVAPLLPSVARQQAVDDVVRSDRTFGPRMLATLEAHGFVPAAFAPFEEGLTASPPAPLVWDDLAESPVNSLIRPFRVTVGDGVGVISFLHGLHDEGALQNRISGVEGARLVDVGQVLSDAYGAYRERMTFLLLLGLLAVIALVAVRHRALWPTVAACAPALLAAAGTVAVLALLGIELNVLSLVALLMVVSMGVDYGVFLAETGGEHDALRATHLAVFAAGLSTILGFGLLSLSDHPALFSIGMTSGIGVLLCLVLAPTVRVLVPGSQERKS